MKWKGTRIRNLHRHLGFIKLGTEVVVGVSDVERFSKILSQIGFSDPICAGDSLLPTAVGPVSGFNAQGKFVVHKDQPMETAYRQIEWHWEQWNGRYDREEQTKIADVPYDRYPRTYVQPPSIELSIVHTEQYGVMVVSPAIRFDDDNQSLLRHVINLFLELFGEYQVFTHQLDVLVHAPVRRLNWEVLPSGKWPWERLEPQVQSIVAKAPSGNQPVILRRLEIISVHNPEFVAVGRAGFYGYIIFGFPSHNLYVLESIHRDNATYVFEEDWEQLSKRTKAEILSEHLQRERIIHREGWDRKIRKLLS